MNLKTIYLSVTLCAAFVGYCSPGIAEVYKWVDEEGKVHFGDRKSAPRGSKQIEIDRTNVAEPVKIVKRPAKPKEISTEEEEKQQQAAMSMQAARWKDQFCRDDFVYEFYFNEATRRCMLHSRFDVVICERRPPSDFLDYIASPEAIITGGTCPAGFPDRTEDSVMFKPPQTTSTTPVLLEE